MKCIKIKTLVFAALLMTVGQAIVSCSGDKAEKEALSSQRDSVIAENEQLNFFIDNLSASMDSVIIEEGGLIKMTTGDGIAAPSRVQILEKVSAFKNIIERQRKMIANLQDTLNAMPASSAAKVNRIVKFYEKQLEEKNNMIAELEKELENKNADISRLTSQVTKLNYDVTSLTTKTNEQAEVMKQQDETIHQCFCVIGTKKELTDAGILTKKLLGKTKVNVNDLNTSKLQKLDKRNVKNIRINGKDPKVMTQMPASSYTITKESKTSYVLTIKDPAAFWSMTNILIVKCD